MLRAERPTVSARASGAAIPTYARDLLLAMASPPKIRSTDSTGWPNWLIPAFRSGGQRTSIRLLEDEL